MFRYLSLFFTALVLSSCSSVSKQDCSQLDWREQGIKDGEEGRRSTYFLQHALKCIESPDNIQYVSGRNEGLKLFCTRYGGFQEGLRGMTYLGQCGAFKSEAKFKVAHELGLDAYRQGEENLEKERKIKELERKISSEFHSGDDLNDLKFDKSILEKDLARGKLFYKELMDKAKSRRYLLRPNKEN